MDDAISFRNINRVTRYQNARANVERHYRAKGLRGAALTAKLRKVERAHGPLPKWAQFVTK